MAENLSKDLKRRLRNPSSIEEDPFSFLRDLTALKNRQGVGSEVQDLVLRCLDKQSLFGDTLPILMDLVRELGLFPYLDPDSLDLADRIVLEAHRTADEYVFHRAQGWVFRELASGENVILSAPTSFGKSLIIDALIAEKNFSNVAIIVPSIALIDETRRRLQKKFGGEYKIITHPSQRPKAKNIYVFTQERLVELDELPDLDFFAIDEFYKLDPTSDRERALLLNQALYRLWKSGAQFYMLGPNIEGISESFPERFDCRFIKTDYATVATDVRRIEATKEERLLRLIELCKKLEGETLIFCSSPGSARTVVDALLEGDVGTPSEDNDPLANWLDTNYHPDWILTKALRSRIGVHHGQIPRAVAQQVVNAFSSSKLDFLVCTSTLIEGVNTPARNMIIFDHKIARKNIDLFTFNNIKGRSGRMFQHFLGQVYVFAEPPSNSLPTVDIPLANEEEMPDSLIVQLDEDDLTPALADQYAQFKNQKHLSIDVIKKNSGIDPTIQIDLAEFIASNLAQYHALLSWRGMPNRNQLLFVCELIWELLGGGKKRRAGVSSGSQLAYRVSKFSNSPDIRETILSFIADNAEEDKSESIEGALEFIRTWLTFLFPRHLMVISRIQRDVFSRHNLKPGDYSYYSSRIENLCLPSGIAALDEYGIPTQVGAKLADRVDSSASIDEAITMVKELRLKDLEIDEFEKFLIREARRFL